ncbi:hypothetical protein EJB05_47383 [Eragrostis curvula]|uniref:Knottins-like domain-containing protein n=1 Tax=Eragrostis curvula TaxID=38414 RepID=A0A5J9T7K1_9POAL|nr:hypothetical protein EJB05_47383 [Eragrostis curvula]
MESSRKLFPAVAILLLIVVATDVAPVQARECEMDSSKFSGLCISAENCANVCRTEGFLDGRCSHFKRRCVCQKTC